MDLLIRNHKCVVIGFLTLLTVIGANVTVYADITPVSDRTPQVRDAIVAAVPGVSSAVDVTEAQLGAITSLNLRNTGITALETGDFSGMTALTSLNLFNNQLRNLPDGIFAWMNLLTTIRIGKNAVDPLPFIVSLEKVADGQFRAVAPAGALFDLVVPITVTDGSITGGVTTLTIPKCGVASDTLTVTRTAGSTADVTVDIGTLPPLPRTHYGYRLVKGDTLPLTVINRTNTAPVFMDGASTTRSIPENAIIGQRIGTSVAATDAENDTLTYTLSGNPDANAFEIDSTTGQLYTKSVLDYKIKNTYTVTVTASDGTLTGTISVTINIIDVNEEGTPSFYEGDSTIRFVLENTGSGVNIGNPVLATDPDNDHLTYTLGGVDADTFDLDSNGQLKTKAPLDYESKRVYLVTITVDDEEYSDTINVIIGVIDVNDTVISMDFVPVADRTPAVRDAIVAAVPHVATAANVTATQVAAITSLNLRNKGIKRLKTGDFSGMISLSRLNLFGNQLVRLPPGIFDGLNALTTLRLGGNFVDPMPLILSLQQVGNEQFKVVITTGAPFNIVLPIRVTNGTIHGGTTSVMIPQGSIESATFKVISASNNNYPIVSFGTLPRTPFNHYGYVLAQSTVCNRTQQVAGAIAKTVSVTDSRAVTEVDLATITSLNLSGSAITSLKANDFAGMFSLKTLYLNNNALIDLPVGVFDDLISLSELSLSSNKLTTLPGDIFSNLTSLTNLYLQGNDLGSLPSDVFDGIPNVQLINISNNKLAALPNGIFEGLTQLIQLDLNGNPIPASPFPLTVMLQKVGTNQFKAVIPTGASFAMTLPIIVTNGTLAGGATTTVIPIGSVESRPINVTRTAGTVRAVTVDIGTPLPACPTFHNGYTLVKSATLPLEVLPPLNSTPVFKDGLNTVRAISENSAAGANIGDPVIATDQDANDTLTYILSGNPDAAAFTVDSKTGQIKTKASLDFETKNRYAVTLTVSDGLATDTIAVTINVTDVDENRAPVFTEGANATRRVAENTPIGTNIGNAITATDPDNDTLTYRLSGTDATAFGMDTETGQLITNVALDYETKTFYTVTVTASDGKLTATITVTVNVTNVDEQPTVIEIEEKVPINNAPVFAEGSSTTRSVSEDAETGVDIGLPITATDPDNDTLTYRLSGTDATAFGMDTETGQLITNVALDYETKTFYTVTVTASDGKLTATITVTVNVTDVDEQPTVIEIEEKVPINNAPVFAEGSSTTRSVQENTGSGIDIGSAISATDADGDTLTYTLGGTDASAFSIDSTTGLLRTDALLDYETKSSYTVTIIVSDGTLTDSITVTITVTDVDETPTNSGPVFTEGSSATRSIDENTGSGIDIGSALSATDADGDTLFYSLSGTDAAAFSIDSSSGQIRTSASLDYETKDSYSVTVNVLDGQGGINSISVTISVTDVNDAPVFTAGSSTTRTVAEGTATNTNIGTVVSATDEDEDTLTFSLGGIDAASFSIVSTTGQLQTQATLDYETKTSYSVTITASDGNLTDTITVTINVTDVQENRAPTFTEGSSTTRSVAENTASGQNIGTAVGATDPDTGDTLTYTLGGTDAASFSIVSTTGQLQTQATLDYETKTSYSVTITVSDSSLTDSIDVTINVTDVQENRAPSFTEGSSTTRSVAENTASDTNIGTAVAATDPDNDTLRYTLSGTDAASFSIVGTSGQLQTKDALDYEKKTSYSVTITASDGNLTDTITVTINVTDVQENRAPSFTEGSSTTRSVPENTASGQNIGTAVGATDPDTGDTLTYTLGGTDAASFSIVSTSGQLQTNASLDYETKNIYSVTVSVSDGKRGNDTITVTINVTDVNEAPSFTDGSNTTRSIAENTASGTNIGTAVAATDADTGDTLTYTLGGTDAASFSIVSTSGQLRTSAALDYETKVSYAVTVSVSDRKGGSDSITVSIKVTDVFEFTPVNERTQQVQDALVAAVPNVNNAADVTAAHLAAITSLSIKNKSITALKVGDFDGLTSLKYLNLSNNSISDISPLENLTTLNNLYLSYNSISDISPLEKFTTLIDINLSHNSISDISPLENLTALTDLKMEYNSISDISPLENLTALTSLNLHWNSISDISPLENLTALKYLYLSNNSISDISPLENLTTLKYVLNLSDNSISDISALENFTSLKYLYLRWNSISDISPLENLTTLNWLGLSNNSISDISPLENLTTLTHLNLHWNPISDISPLENLTALTDLNLSNNSISDISPLENLTALIELSLNNNSINDVSVVEGLTELTDLGLSGNPISDYSPLSRLKTANPSVSIDININNNPPVFADGDSTTRSIPENTISGTNIGTAIAATDTDTADTLIYSLGGKDAESFSIVSTSGQLQTSATLDYETKSSYTVTVDVSDGNDGLDRITVTINITDVLGSAPSVETPPIIPDNTDLLSNFPNPFNPETWIPYQLAKPTEVTLTIYNMRGVVVRTIALGHQAAGVYTNRSRAIHWDGRNSIGEKVAAGVYFYTFTAGDFTATRKMLIRK